MSKASSGDILTELEEFLSDNDVGGKRLTAYLRRQAAQPRQPKKQSVFEGFKMDLDFDVHFTKRAKAQAIDARKNAETNKRPLGNSDNELIPPIASEAAAVAEVEVAATEEAPQSPTHENMPPRAVSVSPHAANRSPRRSGLRGSAGSDRLRRVAIRRRSQSNGRRQLLQEFNDLTCISSPGSFLPQLSSTPASQLCPSEKPVKTKSVDPVLEMAQLRQQCEDTFQQNLLLMQTKSLDVGGPALSSSQKFVRHNTSSVSSQRPSTPDSAGRRTYTIEKGPEPGQLLLSPSRTNVTAGQKATMPSGQPVVRLRRTAELKERQTKLNTLQDVLVPNTPERVVSSPANSVPNTEVFVPETQPQEVPALIETDRLLQNISRSTSAMVVIPIGCKGHYSEAIAATTMTQPPITTEAAATQTSHTTMPQIGLSMTTSAGGKCVKQTAPCKSNQSVQTSDGPLIDNIDVLTDDDSDKDETPQLTSRSDSRAPLNLAPSGGNTTRQRRLRRRNYRTPVQELSTHVLNLHQGANGKRLMQKERAQPPLNKPPNVPINGEQFASELARMSNYEILDLRKRNSLGAIYPLNGQRKQTQNDDEATEQQTELDQYIEREMVKRNLISKGEGNRSQSLEQGTFTLPPPPPPADFSDKSSSTSLKSSTADGHSNTSTRELSKKRRPGRPRRREPPMTKELRDYLAMSQTLERRSRCRSRSSTKRSLYTKGDSDTEGNWSPSPEKQVRLSTIEIAPAPPAMSQSFSSEPIDIVPPPPSHRGSNVVETAAEEETELLMPTASPPPQFARRSSRTKADKSSRVSQSAECSVGDKTSKESLLARASQMPEFVEPSNQVAAPQGELLTSIAETSAVCQSGPDNASEYMETLQLLPTNTQAVPEQAADDDDEQPSTSQAARLALERSKHFEEPPKASDGDVFKKPLAPAPRRKKKSKSREIDNLRITHINDILADDSSSSVEDSSLRRSKRGNVPLKNTWVHSVADPYQFDFLHNPVFEPKSHKVKPRKPQHKEKETFRASNILAGAPLCSSTPFGTNSITATTTSTQGKRKRRPQQQKNTASEALVNDMDTYTSGVERLPEIVENDDQTQPLKEAEHLPPPTALPSVANSEERQQDSFTRLVSWLRGEGSQPLESSVQSYSDTMFNAMRISSVSNLVFSEVEGIEYAFYDTEQRGSLGYMRFKPLQQRSSKRAKSISLDFIALFGVFTIDTTSPDSEVAEHCVLSPGDLVEIKKGSRYVIQNTLNAVSMLLVMVRR